MSAIASRSGSMTGAAIVLTCVSHVLWAADLTATPGEQATARFVAKAAAAQHYRSRPLDAQLSAEMYQRFLGGLDPGREILSSEDVAGFDKYRDHFAVALRDGELDDVFAIYTVFRARLDERLNAVRVSLATPVELKSDDTLPVRGADAAWLERQALDGFWHARLENELLTLVLAGRTRASAVDILRKRYEQLGTRAAALTSEDVFQLFVDAYARSLDPHSEYFLPRRAQRPGAEQAPLEGIGVQLRTDREFVAVRKIFDGGAADRSSRLHIGDRVLAVGQGDSGELVDVVGWTLDPVVDLIRGPVGSTVRL